MPSPTSIGSGDPAGRQLLDALITDVVVLSSHSVISRKRSCASTRSFHRGRGLRRATKVVETQRQAIGIARGIAQNQKTEMLIRGENGRIRERNSYSSDPHPPKD